MFKAAILAYIFEMPSIQFLIYKIKALIVPHSKPLQRLAQFLHVSVVLIRLKIRIQILRTVVSNRFPEGGGGGVGELMIFLHGGVPFYGLYIYPFFFTKK